jgi:hypothetical protein
VNKPLNKTCGGSGIAAGVVEDRSGDEFDQVGLTPGAVRGYQLYYRDPVASFCPLETFNVTNAVRVTWGP